jgi:phosphatidylinositol alpha-1,6-mannosyltransferase
VSHLLVTNDFPPKMGGIGSYLWELWRRIPADRFAVLALGERGSAMFDADEPYRIERVDASVLLPTKRMREATTSLANEIGATLVVLDPALPLGLLGPSLDLPYAVVLHGAEVTIPARLPGLRNLLRPVLEGASLLIAAGEYPAAEARRLLGDHAPRTVIVPPPIDTTRFRPMTPEQRLEARARFGLPLSGALVVSVSRLVPRKGMDVLIESSRRLVDEGRELVVAISGTGRDAARLSRLAERLDAPVRFLGAVDDADLPALYAASDVFAMLCRNRWGGLEQEGYGIVFGEAAACGVPQVAGLSGGSRDAVLDEETGLLVDRPADVIAATTVLRRLLDDAALRARLGESSRRRAVEDLDGARLARTLDDALRTAER